MLIVSLVVEWLSFIELLIINRQNILLYKIAEIEQNTWIHNLNMRHGLSCFLCKKLLCSLVLGQWLLKERIAALT